MATRRHAERPRPREMRGGAQNSVAFKTLDVGARLRSEISLVPLSLSMLACFITISFYYFYSILSLEITVTVVRTTAFNPKRTV